MSSGKLLIIFVSKISKIPSRRQLGEDEISLSIVMFISFQIGNSFYLVKVFELIAVP